MNLRLKTIKERIIGELRHRVVRRVGDGTYWYVTEELNESAIGRKWLPMPVNPRQNGKESAALAMFWAHVSGEVEI